MIFLSFLAEMMPISYRNRMLLNNGPLLDLDVW